MLKFWQLELKYHIIIAYLMELVGGDVMGVVMLGVEGSSNNGIESFVSESLFLETLRRLR